MPRTICAVDTCDKQIAPSQVGKAKYCQGHKTRLVRTGSLMEDVPLGGLAPKHSPVCAAEGCDRPSLAQARWCAGHASRVRRQGDPQADVPLREYPEKRGAPRPAKDGYLQVWKPKHPLANKSGYVPLGRLVLWEKLAGADADCHICGRRVSWALTAPAQEGALVADHLDFNPLNNVPDNLLPACCPCNAKRRRPTPR